MVSLSHIYYERYILWWRDIPHPTFDIKICRGIDGYGSSGGGTNSSSFTNGPSLYQLLTCIYLITAEIDILKFIFDIQIYFGIVLLIYYGFSHHVDADIVLIMYCVYTYDLYY